MSFADQSVIPEEGHKSTLRDQLHIKNLKHPGPVTLRASWKGAVPASEPWWDLQAAADVGDPEAQYALGVLFANLLEDSTKMRGHKEGV